MQWRAWLLCCAALPAHAGAQDAAALVNPFHDPFVPVTSAMAGCPVPEAPRYTAQQVRDLNHERTQHGASCYLSGRCRLANSYLYDAEIVPRVQQYIRQDGRFDDTSVWVLGQRRIVTLLGCVPSAAQARLLEQAVGLVDDVMGVVNLLYVPGAGAAQAPYPVAPQR